MLINAIHMMLCSCHVLTGVGVCGECAGWVSSVDLPPENIKSHFSKFPKKIKGCVTNDKY
jgi:hypothetical protein